MPSLSIAFQLYQRARPPPICAIHGDTCSGGASRVIACVALKRGFRANASTGRGRRLSGAVATHVAKAIYSKRAFAVPRRLTTKERNREPRFQCCVLREKISPRGNESFRGRVKRILQCPGNAGQSNGTY